jgi:hypothetical protein
MKKIILSLALSIAMMATAMAQEERPVVTTSANTTTAYETTESSNNGFWSERPYIKGARFNVYFDFGFGIGGYKRMVYTTSGSVYDTESTLLGLQIFNPTLGVRIFDYGFVGVQLGYTDVEMLFSKVIRNYSTQRVNMFTQGYPIMLDFRGYFPINKDIHPYIEYAFGWSPEFIFYESYNGSEDWMYEYNDVFHKSRLGVGIDIRRLSLGLGWNRNWGYENNGSKYKRDYFYMKIGVKVGRRE